MKKLKLLLWITMATTGLEMMGFAMNESAQAAAGPPSVAVQNAEWNQGHLLVPVRPLIEPLEDRTVTLIWIGGAWKVERVDIRIRTLTTGFAEYAPMH